MDNEAIIEAKVKFDLSDLDVVAGSEEGAEIELTHPITKEPTGIFITVFGKESSAFRNTMNARYNEEANREALALKNNDASVVPIEKTIADNIDLLAKCTKGWRNMIFNKKPIEFSYDSAVMVYTKWPWMRPQVDAAIGDLANFIKA
jgi:hypothetical protein